jgi:hypothetical protein
MSKPQKFFNVVLDNDLNSLKSYLVDMESLILDENILNVSKEEMLKHGKGMGSLTKLGIDHYNIFTFIHPGIYQLYKSLGKLMKDVCEYYEIDMDKEKYLIHGWFNLDQETPNEGKNGGVNPLKYPNHFHDHMNGIGAPAFHGYYCVDAEPSSTFYKIDRNEDKIFENVNKNNRAIISETGHPHGRDDWFQKNPRITIAYDIVPSAMMSGGKPGKWIPLS